MTPKEWAPMQEAPYRLVPLRRRDHSIWAEALVDSEDYDHVVRWRWGEGGRLRIRRRIRTPGGIRDHLLAWELLGITSGRICFRNGNRLDHRKANLAVRPQPCFEGGLCFIPLCSGRNEVHDWAVIDADDSPSITDWTWAYCAASHTPYAIRQARELGIASYGMHRHLMALLPGDLRQVDHINGNGLDNRRCNLRVVAGGKENMQNIKLGRYRGVSWDSGTRSWRVQVYIDGVHHSIGRYRSRETAAEVAIAVRRFVPFAVSENDLPPAAPLAPRNASQWPRASSRLRRSS